MVRLERVTAAFRLRRPRAAAGGGEALAEVAEQITAHLPTDDYPYPAELTFEHVVRPGYDLGQSLEFGQDFIIHGFDRAAEEGGALLFRSTGSVAFNHVVPDETGRQESWR